MENLICEEGSSFTLYFDMLNDTRKANFNYKYSTFNSK